MNSIASVILMVAQVLPLLQSDIAAATSLMDTASAAIKKAQAGDGTIAPEDQAALDAQRAAAEQAFTQALNSSAGAPLGG